MRVRMEQNEFAGLVKAAFEAWPVLNTAATHPFAALRITQTTPPQALLASYLQRLASTMPESAEILRRRYVKEERRKDILTDPKFTKDNYSYQQRKGIKQIAQWLLADETAVREQHAIPLERHLEAKEYVRLFGIDKIAAALETHLLDARPGQFTLVGGLGGIGKTAVADQAVRRVLRAFEYDHILWHRYRPYSMNDQSRTPDEAPRALIDFLAAQPYIDAMDTAASIRKQRVHQALHDERHLIVLDNIEEAADLTAVLAATRTLLSRSHLVITSRSQPPERTGITITTLSQIDEAASIALLQHEAPELNAVAAEQLIPLVQTVGGNPLALKLVAGLTQKMTVPQLVADLTHRHSSRTDAMYKRIYDRAWRNLDSVEKEVLYVIGTAADRGSPFEQVRAITGLDEKAVWNAIDHLLAHSLLEVRGDLAQKRFGVHRLTAQFLQTVH